MKLRAWLELLRAGDLLVFSAGTVLTVVLALAFWRGDTPRYAVVRSHGELYARLSLSQPGVVEVKGPIGVTRIEVQPGRARVQSDPGIHQYCVRQGWLQHAGSIAICAPNQVSLALEGSREPYDTMSY